MAVSWIQIGRVRVDSSITELSHRCDPVLCSGGQNCCECFEVSLSSAELVRCLGLLEEAAGFQPRLRTPGDEEDFFEEDDDGISLRRTTKGRCRLAYRRGGRILCSLHSAAMKLGLPPFRYKPRSCSLWPLATYRDRHAVYLSVADEAWTFPCNRKREPAVPLDEGVGEIIAELFGRKFLEELHHRLASRVVLRHG